VNALIGALLAHAGSAIATCAEPTVAIGIGA
jgi:hypothetical protein